ncbi:MAG TPA: BTAD domain-containing putative transcriptional regulator [Micromonosporaceae bacterium]|nr:BTAD domain-containing putative transcriptional regulator [Micromonosporaceae bacterium]
MSDGIELRILGPLQLLRAGVPVPIGAVKPRLVLATLALHHGRTVSVDQLIDVLWPRDPPRSAVANVHTYISLLRGHLGKRRLRRQPPGYQLQLSPVELDVARFDRLADGREFSTLDAALALWRGSPVENLAHPPLWTPEVRRLLERWRAVRQARARLLIETGDPGAALPDLQALVTEEPLCEEAWRLLVTALEGTGRRAEALAAYAQARRVFVEELGIEPGEPLRRLHRHLLLRRETPALADDTRLDHSAAAVLRGIARLKLGPVPAWVAAALLNRGCGTVLDQLDRGRLLRRVGVDEAGQERFALPVLVELLAPDLPAEPDNGALDRVLGGYLELAERAARGLPAQIFGPGVSAAPRWPVPDADRLTADPTAWFTAERTALLRVAQLAAEHGRSDFAWEFAHAMVPWCDLGGHTAEWEETHRVALEVCRRAGDLLGEAVTLRGLGQLRLYRDDYPAAAEAFSRSRLMYARVGNSCGEAGALAGLGAVHRIRGELDTADGYLQQALAAYVSVGDRHGQAYAHGALGMVWLARGDLDEAGRWLQAGLKIADQVGDRHRVAHLTHQIGVVGLRAGRADGARAALSSALNDFVALGDVHGQALCHRDLAELERGTAAIERLTRALEIFERIGNRRAQAQTAQRLGELHREAGRDGLSDAYLTESRRLQSAVEG